MYKPEFGKEQPCCTVFTPFFFFFKLLHLCIKTFSLKYTVLPVVKIMLKLERGKNLVMNVQVVVTTPTQHRRFKDRKPETLSSPVHTAERRAFTPTAWQLYFKKGRITGRLHRLRSTRT